ncbi:MAG: hypothetical protein EBY68_04720 [Actinobacteria bacterium]|nr:hypothetical protein [Actinomycetota bacterium]
MARIPKLEKNRILADLIEKWARKYGLMRDPYVARLLVALKENQNLAMWSAMEPMQMLPYATPVSGLKLQKIAARLSILRNALVFAPVAFTWLAVGQATTAFQKFVETNSTATVNFLEFWQNGYDVLDEKWRISTVALTDALIVFIVIFLSVGATYLADLANDRSQEEDSVLLEERAELALAIKEYLYTKQTVTRLTLNQGIATAIENLVEATENLQKRRRK